MHYWSLKNDPAVWDYWNTGVPENHLVTYTRRTTVARQFLISAREDSAGRLSRPQVDMIDKWELEVASVHRRLIFCLAKKQGEERIAWQQWDKGNLKTQTRPEIQRQVSTSSLPKLLESIDPTLKNCKCQ